MSESKKLLELLKLFSFFLYFISSCELFPLPCVIVALFLYSFCKHREIHTRIGISGRPGTTHQTKCGIEVYINASTCKYNIQRDTNFMNERRELYR